MKVTVISIITGLLETVPKCLVSRLEDLESRHHLKQRIAKIGCKTEKSPVDLRIPSVTQTPVKDHQLKLV